MAPGGLRLQAHRHVKCLHTASVWASVWKRACQEPHHHNRRTAAQRQRVPYRLLDYTLDTNDEISMEKEDAMSAAQHIPCQKIMTNSGRS